MNKEELYQKIATRILQKRRDRDLSQEQLANEIGKSQSWIQKIESGKKPISLFLLYQLSEVLQCSIYGLIPETNEE
ncbi:helix-turn-helix domain-containing protein [Entomomonas asaccharolytica]|uniref:Helix-turn-helix transcriptional regulator n=1 Tax=Entomomonas asaccharolytica TaxID=2785331 RepID=A0A974NG41_9GAMM|nr:helix-turn-helix transcriptional regulator [Entomomonas asaccharolytica]QQP85742.1 helix-turn-helix transcriptional regulator [Entomomonas asaccharolytica]